MAMPPNVRRDLAGFFTGVDTRVGTTGASASRPATPARRTALDGRGSANVETAHLAGYGGWSFGAFNLRGGGAFAWHTIDTDRTIAFPGFFDRATANYNGRTGQIFGEVGYGFAFGNVAVEPFAGAAGCSLTTDAANERGGPAALDDRRRPHSRPATRRSASAPPRMIPLGDDMVLIPRASLAWQHAFNERHAGCRACVQSPRRRRS